MSILIKNGRVWDGEKFLFADILTDGKTIEEISENIEKSADFIFDAKGKIVSCGLIDIHTHMKGISSDDFGISAEMSCIPFGVTVACDASGVQGNERLLSSFGVKSRVFAATDVKDNHIVKESLEERIKRYGRKIEGLKLFFDVTSPEVKDITPLAELCEYAHSRNMKVMVHSSNSPVPMQSLLSELCKGDILTHAYHGGANNSAEDNFECLKAAKSHGIIVDVGFAGHVHTDFEVLRQGIESGAVPDTISTDITRLSAYKRGGRYGMTMCMSIARYLGMNESDIFRAVTSSAAKAVGAENRYGYLKIGGIADIAVFDKSGDGFDLTDKSGNHIECQKGYKCVLTVYDGETVYKY